MAKQLPKKLDGNDITNLVGGLDSQTRRIESLTANRTLTEKDGGVLFLCNKAASLAITLPALETVDIGTTYEFLVQTPVSGGDLTITAQSGDLLAASGKVTNYDTDTSNAAAFYAPDGSDDLITTLNGSTKGGIGGDSLKYVATSPTQWVVTGTVFATGAPATLFS